MLQFLALIGAPAHRRMEAKAVEFAHRSGVDDLSGLATVDSAGSIRNREFYTLRVYSTDATIIASDN
jgi:hypothetical protein